MELEEINDDESMKQEAGKGRQVSTFETPVLASSQEYFRSSLVGGLTASMLLLLYTILLDVMDNPATPLRVFASLVMGNTALSGDTSIALVVPVGILAAIVLSVLWSAVFGLLLAGSRSGWTPGNIITLGMVFGSVMWLVNFYVLAPIFWPWVVPLSSVYLFLGHVFLFGLPLGGWVASHTMR